MALQQIAPQAYRDFSSGVNAAVSNVLAPRNSVRHALNYDFDVDYGYAKLRKGTTLWGGGQLVAEDNATLGMHNFRNTTGSSEALLVSLNALGDGSATIYSVTSTGKTAVLQSDTPSTQVRFETFLNTVVRVNGSNDPASWTGSGAWQTSGGFLDVGNMPNGIDVINFKDRLHVLSASGILYRSSVPTSASSYTTISWTSGNQTIPIDPDNGGYAGKGIGMAKISGLLLIFKERAMYTFNGSSIQADILVPVGSSSAYSIITGDQYVAFFNPEGIWITNGSYPKRISQAVQPYIDGMSASFYGSVNGFSDGRHFFFFIGDSTVDGTTYSNVMLRWSIFTQEWAVYSWAHSLRQCIRYIDSSTVRFMGGDSTARVLELFNGNTDNGTAIPYELITQYDEYGTYGRKKRLSHAILAYGDNVSGGSIEIDDGENGFKQTGMLSGKFLGETINTFVGKHFRFRITGSSSTGQHTFKGFELPTIQLEDYA